MKLTKEHLEQSFMPIDIALEIIGFLEMARCGKPGMPNTIWAMTKEIIERAEKTETYNRRLLMEIAELKAERDGLQMVIRSLKTRGKS